MYRSTLVFIALFAALVVACQGGGPLGPSRTTSPAATVTSPSAPASPAVCSASGLSASMRQEGLPAPVAETRLAIAEAAVACDYKGLEELTLGGGDFIYSFGGSVPPTPGEAAEFWRDGEEREDQILATLVKLLELPYARRGGDYVWPSAFKDNPTEADWDALEAVYTRARIESFKEFGGYIGLRIGIGPKGDWKFFVDGD